MLRVSSLTVNTVAVFGKRSVVTVMSSEFQKTFRDSSTSLRMTSGSVLRMLRVSSETVKKVGSLLEEIGG